jgi:hypothetical protein
MTGNFHAFVHMSPDGWLWKVLRLLTLIIETQYCINGLHNIFFKELSLFLITRAIYCQLLTQQPNTFCFDCFFCHIPSVLYLNFQPYTSRIRNMLYILLTSLSLGTSWTSVEDPLSLVHRRYVQSICINLWGFILVAFTTFSCQNSLIICTGQFLK